MFRKFSKVNFLISLLMIVVTILGLSTATYAWFEANTVVNLTTISFGARTNARGGALYLGWTVTDKEYAISFYNPELEEDMILPMMPVKEPVIGQTTYEEFLTNSWKNNSVTQMASGFTTGFEELHRNGTVTYLDYDEFATPYTCRQSVENESQTYFYIINDETDETQRVVIDYAITGALQEKLCIAVFINDIFMGVMTNAETISYGNISRGTLVSDTLQTSACIAGHPISVDFPETAIIFDIPPKNRVTCRMVVWYDGVKIESDDSDLTATLSRLSFTGKITNKNDQPLPNYWN